MFLTVSRAVNGSAIYAIGFDLLAISCRVSVGDLGFATSYGAVYASSSVANSRVEVINSKFEGFQATNDGGKCEYIN